MKLLALFLTNLPSVLCLITIIIVLIKNKSLTVQMGALKASVNNSGVNLYKILLDIMEINKMYRDKERLKHEEFENNMFTFERLFKTLVKKILDTVAVTNDGVVSELDVVSRIVQFEIKVPIRKLLKLNGLAHRQGNDWTDYKKNQCDFLWSVFIDLFSEYTPAHKKLTNYCCEEELQEIFNTQMNIIFEQFRKTTVDYQKRYETVEHRMHEIKSRYSGESPE